MGLTTAWATYYYRKKEDLAAACLMRAIKVMDAMAVNAMAAAPSSPAERMTCFIRLYFERLAQIEEGRALP